MIGDHILDFSRIDIVSARHDQIIRAVEQVEEPVGVDATDVPRLDPAVDHTLRGFLGIIPETLHLAVFESGDDLSRFVGPEHAAIGIADLKIDEGHSPAYRLERRRPFDLAEPFLRPQRGDGQDLGLSVGGMQYLVAEDFARLTQRCLGYRRGGAQQTFQL